MTVNVFATGAEVYETEGDVGEGAACWDELRIDYLLATLPVFFIEKCAAECEALAVQFGLRVELDGVPLGPGKIYSVLKEIADNLTAEWDEPGSETLGILIEQLYGR